MNQQMIPISAYHVVHVTSDASGNIVDQLVWRETYKAPHAPKGTPARSRKAAGPWRLFKGWRP